MVILESKRLILRKFNSDDWQDLYEYLSKEEVVKYEPYSTFSQEDCKKEATDRSDNNAFWAVCLKENNKMIGNVYFQGQEPKEFMSWEIGYVFNPAYYGKGYATEACRRMFQYAFEELGAHRISARCNPENTASWKLMERLSMRREGYYKKRAFFKRNSDGKPKWHDAFEYAILEEEWFNLN
jgi:RimJ/RimL family protein N-acetyltransferase